MNFSKLIGSLFFGLMAALTVLATGQTADKIVYKGVERDLFTNPLESFYATDPERRPNFMIAPLTSSTGNWRGYIATWEISEGKLFLTKLDSWICNNNVKESCEPARLSDLFPKEMIGEKVPADWFTGDLRVPDGKQLLYVHQGYGSIFERDLVFKVKSGIVGEPLVIDNTKRELPTPLEAARIELEKLKDSPVGDKPAFGPAKPKDTGTPPSKREPKSGIVITPGQDVFSVGTKKAALEAVIGDGESGSKYKDVYFAEYPKAGVEVSYENVTDRVHVIFLYNGQTRYENFITPTVKTDKGIGWSSSADDILKAYGKPLKDFDDASKSWRRLEYPGIDFLFQGGKLGRIGILGPDGN